MPSKQKERAESSTPKKQAAPAQTDRVREDVRPPARGKRSTLEIETTDQHELRRGQSLSTHNHEVIRAWADHRKAAPATVPGTEHGDLLGVLRFDFPGYGGRDLEHVDWEQWFRTFDKRNLSFVYQEHKRDGAESNFFRLTNPDREDG